MMWKRSKHFVLHGILAILVALVIGSPFIAHECRLQSLTRQAKGKFTKAQISSALNTLQSRVDKSEVEPATVSLKVLSPTQIELVFTQIELWKSYPYYSDYTVTFVLENAAGKWHIVNEYAIGPIL